MFQVNTSLLAKINVKQQNSTAKLVNRTGSNLEIAGPHAKDWNAADCISLLSGVKATRHNKTMNMQPATSLVLKGIPLSGQIGISQLSLSSILSLFITLILNCKPYIQNTP